MIALSLDTSAELPSIVPYSANKKYANINCWKTLAFFDRHCHRVLEVRHCADCRPVMIVSCLKPSMGSGWHKFKAGTFDKCRLLDPFLGESYCISGTARFKRSTGDHCYSDIISWSKKMSHGRSAGIILGYPVDWPGYKSRR